MTQQIDELMALAHAIAMAARNGNAFKESAALRTALQAALKECRNATLEEAAKVTESFAEECSPDITHASEIRKLKS